MNDVSTRRDYHWILMAGIVLLALSLRLYHLGYQSLWGDELWSVWFSDQTFPFLWNEVPKFETHPPLYYSILKIWRGLVGSDEFSLRLLSTVFNILTIPLIYTAARICGGPDTGKQMGALAAFLLACSLMQIRYSQEARPYGIYIFAMALAVLAICWLIKNPARASLPLRQMLKSDRWTGAAYIALACGLSLLQWLHNLGGIFIIVMAGALGVWWLFFQKANRQLLINLAAAGVLSFLLYLPFLKDFIFQLNQVSGDFWLQTPGLKKLILRSLNLYGESLEFLPEIPRVILYLLTIAPLAALGFYGLTKKYETQKYALPLFLVTAAFAPLILNVTITYLKQPIFLERVLLGVQIPWYILLSAAPFAFEKYRKAVIAVLAIIFLSSALSYHQNTERFPHNVEPWREIIETIVENNQDDLPVLKNFINKAFRYYGRPLGLNKMITIVETKVTDQTIGTGTTKALAEENLQRIIKEAKQAGGVWLVIKDGGNPNDIKLIEELSKHFKKEILYDKSRMQLFRFKAA